MYQIEFAIIIFFINMVILLAYQLYILFEKHKKCLIISQVLNLIILFIPFALHEYEILASAGQGRTGLDALPI